MQESWSHFFNGRGDGRWSRLVQFQTVPALGPAKGSKRHFSAAEDCGDHGHLHHASKSYEGLCMAQAGESRN
jgi:hypothetical protein